MSLIHEVCHFCWRDINKPEERKTAFFVDAYVTKILELGQDITQKLLIESNEYISIVVNSMQHTHFLQ